MATLHKFKLLATQCAVATSPTRSPTASPVIHLRRRKTLRMLLRKLPNSDDSTDRRRNSPEKVRHKLKDLFVSSPPPLEDKAAQSQTLLQATGSSGGGSNWRRVGPRSLRPFSAALRQRLLRRAWRPVLVSIPE